MDKENKVKITRRVQREIAFQLLYELNARDNIYSNNQINSFEEENIKELKDNRKKFIEEYFVVRELDIKNYNYVTKIINLYIENSEEIEKKLEENIYGWKINRVGKTEISIIRIATTEMMYVEDIPPAVSINEAVELSKIFAEEKAYKFVNKVLRNIYESIK